MRKILAITYKDVKETFTDQSLLLLMLVTPLVLSTIIALSFSNVVGDSSSPISDIPVALVNLDEGTQGAIFVSILAPSEATETTSTSDQCEDTNATATDAEGDNGLLQLTETTVLADAEAARAGVDSGDYAAAIIVPANFSESIEYSPSSTGINPAPVEVYGDANRSISASVIESVTQGIVNQLLAGQITVAATINTLIDEGQGMQAMNVDNCAFAAAFDASNYSVQIEQQAAGGEEVEQPNLLVIFGSAQAAFFALFTASGTAQTILEERREWTLQRMLVSPTPRIQILMGKLLAVFANVLLQLVLLFIGFTLVASLLEGEFTSIWGSNVPAIVVMVIATAVAAAGVGTLIAALARTPEQAGILGSVVALFMGAAGGAFFQIGEAPALFDAFTRLSIVRWGSEGFTRLAEGSADVLPNVIALVVMGGVMFLIGLVVFNRRQDV